MGDGRLLNDMQCRSREDKGQEADVREVWSRALCQVGSLYEVCQCGVVNPELTAMGDDVRWVLAAQGRA